MKQEETDQILQKLKDCGFDIVDMKESSLGDIQIISNEYFNEKVNEVLNIDPYKESRIDQLEQKAWEKMTGEDVGNNLSEEEAEEYYSLLCN